MAAVRSDLERSVDAVFEATADLLVYIGAEPGKLYPNPPVNTSALEAAVSKYQAQLNTMEVRLMRAIARLEKAEAIKDPVAAEESSKDSADPMANSSRDEIEPIDETAMEGLDDMPGGLDDGSYGNIITDNYLYF